MISVPEIRNQLALLLAGQISLDDFEEWFLQRSRNAHQDSDESAIDLVFAIENQFSQSLNDQEILEGLRSVYSSSSAAPSIVEIIEFQSIESGLLSPNLNRIVRFALPMYSVSSSPKSIEPTTTSSELNFIHLA